MIDSFLNMPKEMIGLIMIGAMLFSIFIGFPISFTLIFLGVVFGLWGGGDLVFFLMTQTFSSTIQSEALTAVPMFILMGFLMEQAGLMERLFSAIQLMLAKRRGSLYFAVLFVATVFAAATGIVGASVTILGIMAAKTMTKSGYDVRMAAGTITAGGTLGILIPPSIMLIVMGPTLEISVNELFAAAFFPGVLLASLYMAYTFIRCMLNKDLGPPLPEDEWPETSSHYWLEAVLVFAALISVFYIPAKLTNGTLEYIGMAIVLGGFYYLCGKFINKNKPGGFYFSDVWREFLLGLVPPAALVTFTLGAIIFGIATPSEAAGCGAFGAFLMTLAYRKMTFPHFKQALIKTLEISVLILFLVAASNFFGAVFSWLGTPTTMTNYLLELDMPSYLLLIMILAFIFLLGWPLEWVPIIVIIVPIMVPVLEQLGFNLLWFAILVAVNLQTAWLSPPVALSAYFLKGVAPQWDLKDIYLGMMQFMVIQLIGLALIFIFPQIALWLPTYLYGN